MIHVVNIKSQITKELVDDVIIDASKTRHKADHNFEVFTKHKDKLYDIFISESKNILNEFTLKDKNFRLWCMYTDKNYYEGDVWHNHNQSSTISGVLYLKTVKGKGIEFESNGNKSYVEPKDLDLVIFPNFLNHRPLLSKKKTRISLNMEIRCNENVNEIFS